MYVIISGEPRSLGAMTVELATGPFDTVQAAETFQELLERTVSGRHKVLQIHTPAVQAGRPHYER